MSMYITVQEFKNAPTGIDTNTLIPGGTQAQNDAELHNVIMRASAWVDQICQQVLEATTNTEIKEVTMNSRGLIRIHSNNAPIIQLLDSVQYRIDPSGPWSSIPLSSIQVSPRYFTIYNLNTFSIPTSLALQYPSMGYRTPIRMRTLQNIQITVQYTYINGFPNTTLLYPVNVGQNSAIALTSGLGVMPGQNLTIYDNDKTETVVVESITSDGRLTLNTPLLFDHSALTPISALPASVKQAAILMASYLVKERGSLSIAMGETSLQGVNRYKDASDIDIAEALLYDFKRGIVT